jgi:UDP-N-acetylmuramoyl-tripeptide--D-alanyl-D-alanine ligase
MLGFDDLYLLLVSKRISGVAVDSRNVLKGNVFFALKGAKTDGHLFLEAAVQNGATHAVVEEDFQGNSFGLQLIRVKDTLLCLQDTAKKFLSDSRAKIIAVTGSLGKTTTKGFIYQLLKSKYKVNTTSGSKNSQIGLALAVLNETVGDEDFLVLEMGMTLPRQIERLTEIAPPDIAIITSIALVHAGNFDSIEDIARAKSEVFCRPKTKLVIVNADTDCANFLMSKANCQKSYSMQKETKATWHLEIQDERLIVDEDGEKTKLSSVDFPARHVYQNLLGAICIARECGMSFAEISQVLPTLTLPERRLQEIEKNGIVFINDSYNAAEISVKGALESIAKRKTSGRKIAVLGNMVELGKFSDVCHKRVGEYALSTVDRLFCIGEHCKPLVEVWQDAEKPVEWFLRFEDLLDKLKLELRAGDLVLVKGSRVLQLERVVELF